MDNLTPLRNAWNESGVRPDVHNAAKDRLAREWPTLYRAIVQVLMTEESSEAAYVQFLGGPYEGSRTHLKRTPPAIMVGDSRYILVTDPDTGGSLDLYVYTEGTPRRI